MSRGIGAATVGATDWMTPATVARAVVAAAGVTIDGAATEESAVHARWAGPGGVFKDGRDLLLRDREVIFLNPEYGAGIGHWTAAAAASPSAVVALVNAKTDTVWFQRDVLRHPRTRLIVFLAGRLAFRPTAATRAKVDAERAARGRPPLPPQGEPSGGPSALVFWAPARGQRQLFDAGPSVAGGVGVADIHQTLSPLLEQLRRRELWPALGPAPAGQPRARPWEGAHE